MLTRKGPQNKVGKQRGTQLHISYFKFHNATKFYENKKYCTHLIKASLRI